MSKCIRRENDVTPSCVAQCRGCSFMEQYPLAAAGAIVEKVKQSALDGTWEPYFRAGMLFTCEKIAEELDRSTAAPHSEGGEK